MCVCIAAGKLVNTIVLAAEAELNGRRVHVMGYENRPLSFSGPNAMILPIPATPGTVTQDALIPTDAFPHVLQDMARAIRPVTRGFFPKWRGVPEVVVFEHGIYTVVLAQHARAVPDALHLVPEAKRPPRNAPLFDAYDRWYPDWAIAVCCFDNAEAGNASPILLTYEPAQPNYLFAPGLDCHTGDVPDLSATVAIDHAVVLSAIGMEGGKAVQYTDPIPDHVRAILPAHVIGAQWRLPLPNGDWRTPVDAVRAGLFDVRARVVPPFV